MDCSSSMLTIEEGAFVRGNELRTARHAHHSPGATRPAESMGRFDLHRVDAIPLCICMFSVACFRSSSSCCLCERIDGVASDRSRGVARVDGPDR